MDSNHDVGEHESLAKRIRLDPKSPLVVPMCLGDSSLEHSNNIDIIEDAAVEEPTSNLTPLDFLPNDSQCSDNAADDDEASTVSELSGLSELSGEDWKPMMGFDGMVWLKRQMQSGANPRHLLTNLGVDLDQVPSYVDEITLWKIIINMVADPPKRNKLRHVNTLDDIVRLIRGSKNIIVLTGAGVSVSCGIPDFRSKDGIYSRLAVDFPDLPDPQAMFDINYFNQDPRPFFKFAKDIYPGKFKPSPCHKFIKLLEKHGKLLRNYTQNIDTLEKIAKIERVIECHGSFASATCTKCRHQVSADDIRDTVLGQRIPLCQQCHPSKPEVNFNLKTSGDYDGDKNKDENQSFFREVVSSGVMKPDIVFFGEGLPDAFHEAMACDKFACDLLLVIGSSLKVRPVALIPSSLPPNVPQIFINREPLSHCRFDVELFGDCDVIVNHLCHMLGGSWQEGIYDERRLNQAPSLLPLNSTDGEPVIANSKSMSTNSELTGSYSWCNASSNSVHSQSGRSSSTCSLDPMLSSPSLSEDLAPQLCALCRKKHPSTAVCYTNDEMLDDQNYRSLELKAKERHISVDSARDSGIGENSNFADLEMLGSTATACSSSEPQTHQPSCSADERHQSPGEYLRRHYWQPKERKNLVERLRPHTYYHIEPNRYIFPGAEVFYDPDDNFCEEEEEEDVDCPENATKNTQDDSFDSDFSNADDSTSKQSMPNDVEDSNTFTDDNLSVSEQNTELG